MESKKQKTWPQLSFVWMKSPLLGGILVIVQNVRGLPGDLFEYFILQNT